MSIDSPEILVNEVDISPQALERYRQEHTISEPVPIAGTSIQTNGRGNIICFHQEDVLRINQGFEEARRRLDSPTILAILQKVGVQAAIDYFPEVKGFCLANLASRMLCPYKTPDYRGNEAIPTIIVERVDVGETYLWSLDQNLSSIFFSLKTPDEGVFRFDCLNAFINFHFLCEAQLALGKFGLLLRDYKSSCKYILDKEGKLVGLKILDIDDLQFVSDNQNREGVVLGEILASGCWSGRIPDIRILEKADLKNPLFASPEFQSLLVLDLATRETAEQWFVTQKLGITPKSLSDLNDLSKRIIAGDYSLGVTVQEYLERRKKLEQTAQNMPFYFNEKTGCLRLDIQRFIKQAYQIPENLVSFSHSLGLGNPREAFKRIKEGKVPLPESLIKIIEALGDQEIFGVVCDHYNFKTNYFIEDCVLACAPADYRHQWLGGLETKNLERLRDFMVKTKDVWPGLSSYLRI